MAGEENSGGMAMTEKRDDIKIPKNGPAPEPEQQVVEAQEAPPEDKQELTQEEAQFIQKVFFEDDEKVRLRDGVTYSIPPLSLRDGVKLMDNLNTINTTLIIYNLMEDENGNNNYEKLLETLLMAFKPYYPNVTVEYLSDYVDLNTAKEILDIMIGLNQIKKSM